MHIWKLHLAEAMHGSSCPPAAATTDSCAYKMDSRRGVLLLAVLICLHASSGSEPFSFALTRRWHVTPLEHLTNTSHCEPFHLWDVQSPSNQKFLFIDIHCCVCICYTPIKMHTLMLYICRMQCVSVSFLPVYRVLSARLLCAKMLQ